MSGSAYAFARPSRYSDETVSTSSGRSSSAEHFEPPSHVIVTVDKTVRRAAHVDLLIHEFFSNLVVLVSTCNRRHRRLR